MSEEMRSFWNAIAWENSAFEQPGPQLRLRML